VSRLRVGINGFGRIGRILFRAGFDRVEIVGVNNLGDTRGAAHLLKYDSAHGIYDRTVEVGENEIIVNGQSVPLSSEKNPAQISWKDWGADVVLECTGAFKKKEDFEKHIQAGAKRVLISAPAEGADLTVVYGVNQELYDPSRHRVLSNASCTTNCLAPMAKVLHDNFGIERGYMTTVHSYTNDQMVLDGFHKDMRRARSAAVSMIPTTTGAARAVGRVLPELSGRIDGCAIRVPTPDASLVDLVFESTRELSVDAINSAFRFASEGQLKGILACEEAPLVSCDFIGNPHSSIVDLPSTLVMGKSFAKVFSWYDNEMGFSHRMVDMALFMADCGL